MLGAAEQPEPLRRRLDQPLLVGFGVLQQLQARVPGRAGARPPGEPAGHGHGQHVLPQPLLEQRERLVALRLAQLVPLDPVLPVHGAAGSGLPLPERGQPALPKLEQGRADRQCQARAPARHAARTPAPR